MEQVTKKCEWCQKDFSVDSYTHKRGNGKFCSLVCVGFHTANKNKPKPNTFCAFCKKALYRNKTAIKNSKTELFFCCMEHKVLAQSFGGPLYNDVVTKDHRLIVFRSGRPLICANPNCKIDDVDLLEIHHKDMNHSNNVLTNLEILCANCHTKEHRRACLQ
jgi:hypothetical protein